MKKRILILALLLTGISYSFANTTDGINKKTVASFNKDFSNAHDIRWERKNDFVLVTFSYNNAVMFAYYTTEGDLIAVARNILSDRLPISQLLSLKKNYSDYWISDLFEVSKNHDTFYYVTLENADHKMVLKSVNDGSWDVYSKKEK